MNVYISGISGTGMGPLALMAKQAGMIVSGSDLDKGAIYSELAKAGIDVAIGEQDGKFLESKIIECGVDWFVYTSALSEDHMELKKAREAGIKCTKRDDFTAYLVDKLGLKMVAVAGTHGKTTTTAMIVWAALRLGIPVAYIVGTTLGFATSGAFHMGDEYFIYEADEYDKNFLKYYPWLAVIPAIGYDHPDIYPTKKDYDDAFERFRLQSENVLECNGGKARWDDGRTAMYKPQQFSLAGEVRRIDAALAAEAVMTMQFDEYRRRGVFVKYDFTNLIDILNEFPGVGRRFEKISDGIYTDYAHHPDEIMATIDMARDEAQLKGKKGVVVIYQPHQNTRQHEVRQEYISAFEGVDKIYWLPTYITRENPDLPVLMPSELVAGLKNKDIAEIADLNEELWKKIQQHIGEGYLVVLMAAGSADGWLRKRIE